MGVRNCLTCYTLAVSFSLNFSFLRKMKALEYMIDKSFLLNTLIISACKVLVLMLVFSFSCVHKHTYVSYVYIHILKYQLPHFVFQTFSSSWYTMMIPEPQSYPLRESYCSFVICKFFWLRFHNYKWGFLNNSLGETWVQLVPDGLPGCLENCVMERLGSSVNTWIE